VSGLEAAILKAIERLTHDLAQLRSGGRLNPELIESLKVQLGTARDGKETVRLRDIAQVVPKGRVVNVMCSEAEVCSPYFRHYPRSLRPSLVGGGTRLEPISSFSQTSVDRHTNI
jgi:hypothetical protein